MKTCGWYRQRRRFCLLLPADFSSLKSPTKLLSMRASSNVRPSSATMLQRSSLRTKHLTSYLTWSHGKKSPRISISRTIRGSCSTMLNACARKEWPSPLNNRHNKSKRPSRPSKWDLQCWVSSLQYKTCEQTIWEATMSKVLAVHRMSTRPRLTRKIKRMLKQAKIKKVTQVISEERAMQ